MSYIKKLIQESETPQLQSYVGNLNKNFDKVKNLLEKYEEAGELIATEHKEINSAIGSVFDHVYSYQIGIKSMITHSQEYQKTDLEHFMFFDSPSTVTGLNKYNKLLNKFDISSELNKTKKAFEYATNITIELMELRERSAELKKLIVTRENKSAVIKAATEKAKKASHKDLIRAIEHLNKVVEVYKDSIVADNKQMVMNGYVDIINALKEDNLIKAPSTRSRNDKTVYAQSNFVYSEILQVEESERNNPNFILKSKEKLEQQAQESAERIYSDLKQFYICRVSEKVATILSHKGNLERINTINLETGNQIEANLEFQFKDLSSFELNTKVVVVNSYEGNIDEFIRVPTTFHNIVTPDLVKHTANLSAKKADDLYLKDYLVKNNPTNVKLKNKM
jgi:hypothetical protein